MKKNKSKAKVITDLKRNRLYIIFDREVRKRDVDQIYTDVRFGVADLKPGFAVINDLSNTKIGHLNGAATFKKITDYLIDNGVGRVIRILGGSSVLFRQLSRISDTITGYTPEYVSSIEEAEQLLEKEPEE